MSERIYKVSQLKPPITVEWTWLSDARGSLSRQALIVERKGRNLRTDEGEWLWWPTINRYNDVRVVEEPVDAK